jgi:hypothetical protein
MLTKNRQEWTDARAASNTVFTSIASGPIHVAITQARRRVDTAYSKLQNAESYVENLENNLGIEERWSNISPEYQAFYQQNVQTSYERALDELERLVVMRLFELTKMSTSGTGTMRLSILIDCSFFKQGTNSGAKLARLSSVVPRRFEMPSAVTIYKQQNWCHHAHPYLGRKSSTTAFLPNSIFYGILERTSATNHGSKLRAVKQWSNISNSAVHKRR